MVTLACDAPKSIMAELSRRAGNTMDMSMLVREALAEHLSTPLQTLFQVSMSGSLVQGVYSEAVTCAKILGGDPPQRPARLETEHRSAFE